jgi:hypothetical protein
LDAASVSLTRRKASTCQLLLLTSELREVLGREIMVTCRRVVYMACGAVRKSAEVQSGGCEAYLHRVCANRLVRAEDATGLDSSPFLRKIRPAPSTPSVSILSKRASSSVVTQLHMQVPSATEPQQIRKIREDGLPGTDGVQGEVD